MKEIIGLLITLSSLLVGVRGGGEGGVYSWRVEEPVEVPVVVQEEGDRIVMPVSLPANRRIPGRIAGVERPDVDAESVLVLEAATGRVLYAENRSTVRPIASLTKLMTALTALDLIEDWNAPVTITKEDIAHGGRAYIYAGDVFNAHDLLNLSLISSSNDAALALSRATGLSRTAFVRAMNMKAHELRLAHSVFAEPTGLDARNVSTAEEVARLLHTALAHPVLQEMLSTKEYHFSTIDESRRGVAMSTDQLLEKTDFGIVGAKTGYIGESGYNFAMQAEGTKGEILTIVILGAKSEAARFTIAKELVEWAERAWAF